MFSVRFHEASRLWSPRLVAMERFASRLSIWMGPSDWHLGRQISSAPRLLQVTYTETHSPCRWIHPSPKTRRVTVSTQTWTLRVTVKRHRRLRLLRLLVPLFPPLLSSCWFHLLFHLLFQVRSLWAPAVSFSAGVRTCEGPVGSNPSVHWQGPPRLILQVSGVIHLLVFSHHFLRKPCRSIVDLPTADGPSLSNLWCNTGHPRRVKKPPPSFYLRGSLCQLASTTDASKFPMTSCPYEPWATRTHVDG